ATSHLMTGAEHEGEAAFHCVLYIPSDFRTDDYSTYRNALLASTIWQKSAQTHCSFSFTRPYDSRCTVRNRRAADRSRSFGLRPHARRKASAILPSSFSATISRRANASARRRAKSEFSSASACNGTVDVLRT